MNGEHLRILRAIDAMHVRIALATTAEDYAACWIEIRRLRATAAAIQLASLTSPIGAES